MCLDHQVFLLEHDHLFAPPPMSTGPSPLLTNAEHQLSTVKSNEQQGHLIPPTAGYPERDLNAKPLL